eukprot:357001-Chlamydomonas_euryale.AAC.10
MSSHDSSVHVHAQLSGEPGWCERRIRCRVVDMEHDGVRRHDLLHGHLAHGQRHVRLRGICFGALAGVAHQHSAPRRLRRTKRLHKEPGS